jgi:hypothetical protein
MMKKQLAAAVVASFILMTGCSCPKNSYPGWKDDIKDFQGGMEGLKLYRGKKKKYLREELYDFLKVNRKLFFKDDLEYERSEGIFDILGGDLIDGLSVWRNYEKESGDFITPPLEMYDYARYLGDYMWFKAAMVNEVEPLILKSDRKLTAYQSSLIILGDSGHASLGMNPYLYIDKLTLDETTKKNYMDHMKEVCLLAKEHVRSDFEKGIPGASDFLDDKDFLSWAEEKCREDPGYQIVLDNMYSDYYWGKRDYEAAWEVGRKYDFEKDYYTAPDHLPKKYSGFNWGYPYIFYKSGHLKELIPFYDTMDERARKKHPLSGEGGTSIEFWLAAAYGQMGEYEKGYGYLKTAVQEASLWDKANPRKNELKEQSLLAIYWFSYMSDVMDPYREAGYFDRIERLYRERLADFSYLEGL